MNIFILDYNLKKNAEYHCDQHVNKMILEAAQMLCMIASTHGISVPYKATHAKHPCTLWAASRMSNYIYLCDYGEDIEAANEDCDDMFHGDRNFTIEDLDYYWGKYDPEKHDQLL